MAAARRVHVEGLGRGLLGASRTLAPFLLRFLECFVVFCHWLLIPKPPQKTFPAKSLMPTEKDFSH